MFDTEKIRRMTTLLEKLPEEFDDVYIVPEIFTREAAALLKRLKIPVKGIMHDTQPGKETCGIPIVKTAEASKNFNERTILILLTEKPVPFIQTTFDFKVGKGKWTLPALVIANDEIMPIYDRVTVSKIFQQYREDGLPDSTKDLANQFACGLSTFLDSQFQNFKYQFSDSRWYPKTTHNFDDTAIVIQGPIEYTNNYTVETFKLYRSIYPNAPIILSTWKEGATNSFRRVCKENAVVLLENEPPKIRAYGNMNMQLKSSLEGVRYVKENTSAKFVLKTRTDQRINYFSFLVYFKNLLKTFPPKGDKLHERIIFLGSQVTKAHPFYPHDFLVFGHVEDIFKLFDIPFHGKEGKLSYLSKQWGRLQKIFNFLSKPEFKFDYDSVNERSHKLFKLNKMMNRIYWPEMYLTRTFYEKYIAPVDATKLYETSWKFTVDYLILVDFDILQLDWPKYEHMRYKPRFDYEGHGAFARWLDMYRNFKIDWV